MAGKTLKEKAPESVDAATLAAIDEGLKLAENGRRWEMDEAFDLARKRRKAWLKKPSDQRTA